MFYSLTAQIVPIGSLYGGQIQIGDREATADEIAADAASKLPSPTQQIDAIEDATMIPRVTREFMLTVLASQASAQNPPLDPMKLPAYAKLKAIDDQIAALRSKITK